MSLMELYVFLAPVTQFLGTVVLFGLSFGALVFALAWFVKTYWKVLVGLGVAFSIAAIVLIGMAGT